MRFFSVIAQWILMIYVFFVTLQGLDFEKSKFKTHFAQKIWQIKRNLLFLNHYYFCLYLQNKCPTIYISIFPKNENLPPFMDKHRLISGELNFGVNQVNPLSATVWFMHAFRMLMRCPLYSWSNGWRTTKWDSYQMLSEIGKHWTKFFFEERSSSMNHFVCMYICLSVSHTFFENLIFYN